MTYITKYTWLRSSVIRGPTLYNARRGKEGSRILLAEWEDAVRDIWVPPDQIEKVHDDAERDQELTQLNFKVPT